MADTKSLKLLCAGAVQGVVAALQGRFLAQTGVSIDARFGAVGALREALIAGADCDVMIVTDTMAAALGASGLLHPASRSSIGKVQTGMAVRTGEPSPDIASAASLCAALRASNGISYPDPIRSTAGIHFAGVLKRLGLDEEVAARCHTFPNGAVAMRALAATSGAGQLGCTQISEILFAAGLCVIGPLPPGLELATAYSAAIARDSPQPDLGAAFVALLTSADSEAERAALGFELDRTD